MKLVWQPRTNWGYRWLNSSNSSDEAPQEPSPLPDQDIVDEIVERLWAGDGR